MVRSVLEILSFSKLAKDSYDDDTYAVRDLSSAQNFYMKQMNLIDEPFTQCGWLKIVDGEYIIEDCKTPGRINHSQIDYALGIEFSKYFKPNKFDGKDGEKKTSEYKYNLVDNKIHTITVGDMYRSEKNQKYDKREFYKYDKNGKNKASLVLTGQPTARQNSGKMGDGKGFEFLFFEPKDEIKLDKEVVENFKFAYFDKRETEPKESPDWKYWKEKLYSGEKIPVFFQKKGNKVLHFGLSYLYKLPYEHSIKHGIDAVHFENRADLAQTIFGYINKDAKDALKGRVQFSHFQAVENITPLQTRKEILGTPRASYYPIYVRQHNTDFITYMDANFSIAGRKRYPIHKGSKTTKTEDTGNDNVGTEFTPLKDGVVFKGKIRYHNLKKAELGAILSALTFHNTPNTYHNIGMAKSLGYGKVDIKLNGIDDITPYLKEFELVVCEQILNWQESTQLKELLTMATEQNNSGSSALKYLKLEQFAKSKSKDRDYLRCYSELENIATVFVNTLIDENDKKELEIRNKEYEEKQKEYELKRKQKKEHDEMFELVKSSENIDFVESFISKYPDSQNIEDAKSRIEFIKSQEDKAREEKEQEEANEQWQKVLKVEQKFKVAALNDFIKNYPTSMHINEAKEILSSLNTPNQPSGFDLSSFSKFKPLAKNIKKLTGQQPLNDEQKVVLENHLLSLKDKAKNYNYKDFASDDLLGKEKAKEIESKLK